MTFDPVETSENSSVDWEALTPSDEVETAEWIGERLHPFAQDVGSVIPAGFDAYARIFHPAWWSGVGDETEVRWSEVAAWSGRTVHPEMQFHSIAARAPGRHTGPQPWNGQPREGRLSDRQTRALIGLLSNHTSTQNDCWFCVWEGYGSFHPGAVVWLRAYSGRMRHIRSWWWRFSLRFPKPKPKLPMVRRVRLPGRDYFLFKEPLATASGHQDGPNLWWPDDRSWCVASEIDFPYTYVGGASTVIEEVLVHPDLEALAATLDQGITADSDKVNS